jgi:ankyrin repeat protein
MSRGNCENKSDNIFTGTDSIAQEHKQNAAIESNPKKSILVLYGSDLNLEKEKEYYGKLLANNPGITIEYQSLADFAEHPPAAEIKYEQIIIHGHGRFKKNQKQQRQLHKIRQDEANLIETAELIKKCAKYTKKILIDSCFSGAVIKALQADYSSLVEAEIVALTGSKYPSILYSDPALKMAEALLNSEKEQDLYQAALEHFPDTICVFYKGKFFKLGAVKIPGNKNGAPNQSAYAVAAGSSPMRHCCELRKKVGQGNGNISSWWEVKGYIEVEIEDTSPEFKNAALAVSVCKGKAEDVRYWLGRGADAGARANVSGLTVLMLAAHNGHFAVVEILADALKDPTKINQAKSNGYTALMIAAQEGKVEVVEILAKKLGPAETNKAGPNNFTALMIAAEKGHVAVVEILADALKDPAEINKVGPDGRTALMIAAYEGHVEVVKILAKKLSAEQINHAGKDCSTALMIAAQRGHVAVVEILADALKDPAEINKAGKGGFTALMLAASKGHVAVVRVLADALTAEQINQATHKGTTALMLAAQNGHVEVAEILAEKLTKAQFAQQGTDIATTLILSAKNGNFTEVGALVKKLNSAKLMSNYGSTSLMLAVKGNHVEVVRVLADALTAEQINCAGSDGRNALRIAQDEGHVEVVKILSERLSADRTNLQSPHENNVPFIDKLELDEEEKSGAPAAEQVVKAPRIWGTNTGRLLGVASRNIPAPTWHSQESETKEWAPESTRSTSQVAGAGGRNEERALPVFDENQDAVAAAEEAAAPVQGQQPVGTYTQRIANEKLKSPRCFLQ